MDKNDFLGILGLETKHTFANQLLGTLGTFGVGLLVGAGVALILAPKAGTELRHDLRKKLHCGCKDDASNGREEAGSKETSGHLA
jgi:gas vesicle protein